MKLSLLLRSAEIGYFGRTNWLMIILVYFRLVIRANNSLDAERFGEVLVEVRDKIHPDGSLTRVRRPRKNLD